jgi:hypothetical protein
MKTIRYLFTVIIVLIAIQHSRSQNLVQSFIESNNVGESSHFGNSVSGAGDVNNDGFNDIIVGAYNYNLNKGRCYIYFGGSSMDDVADVVITGNEGVSSFGFSVAGGGDVNGDGYDDIIVGAPCNNSHNGYTFIFFGGFYMDTIPDVTMISELEGCRFGWSVSDAGDVDKDGYDDVIIGDHSYNGIGKIYVYFGGATMDNIPDLTVIGEGYITDFGISVSNAGDLNGDGYDDIIVGEDLYNSRTGRAYIFFGSELMDNIADVIMTGEDIDNFFGGSVSDAGDINKDGYDDVLIWNPGAIDGHNSKVAVYYGGSSMDNVADLILKNNEGEYFGISFTSAGDLNNDGFDDLMISDYTYNVCTGRVYVFLGGVIMDDSIDFIITGEERYQNFGYSVSNVGDVNGDGFSEVLIGSFDLQKNHKAYLYNFKPVVEENLTLNDSTLAYGDIQCYNALQNITVSEIPSVILHDGATATFIAGSSIRFLPGFYAESGSIMSAYITTDASFCEVVVSKSVSDLSLVAEVSQKPSDIKKGAGDIKLYPNPNSGTFTLELSNFGPQTTIVIYNLLGERVARFSHTGNATQPVNLEGIRKGIYMVEVTDGKNRLMKKMIVK